MLDGGSEICLICDIVFEYLKYSGHVYPINVSVGVAYSHESKVTEAINLDLASKSINPLGNFVLPQTQFLTMKDQSRSKWRHVIPIAHSTHDLATVPLLRN